MFVNVRLTRDAPPRPAHGQDLDANLTALLVLRLIETSGPLTGLETLNQVAPTAGMLGLDPPGYPILHALIETGHLEAESASPRRYRITASGIMEAERLARLCWPRLSGRVEQMRSRIALAYPRVPRVSPASEWTDEPLEQARTGRG